jgi:hypothetical protein
MPIDGEYEPSPWEPISEQVQLFESTGGAEGAELEGSRCIILWTLGSKSHKIRKTPLIRAESGADRPAVGAQPSGRGRGEVAGRAGAQGLHGARGRR